MGVNKVFCGMREPAQAMIDGKIDTVAESRVENLKLLGPIKAKKCLLRAPGPSEVEAAVAVADIILLPDGDLLSRIADAAKNQNRRIEIMPMVDMGDLREGIWFEDESAIAEMVSSIVASSNLSLYGLGTNFNCFGAIKPTQENGDHFVRIARSIERTLRVQFQYLSGGNCTSYHLLKKGIWPEGINQIRSGGLHQYGIDFVDFEYVSGFIHSSKNIQCVSSPLFVLSAEVNEISKKPTAPVGEPGLDAFLKPKQFADRGVKRRAILAMGRQDVPSDGMWPCDSALQVLGQSSDHTIVETESSLRSYQVGDLIDFELDYVSLLFACNSPSVRKVFVSS